MRTAQSASESSNKGCSNKLPEGCLHSFIKKVQWMLVMSQEFSMTMAMYLISYLLSWFSMFQVPHIIVAINDMNGI